MGSYGTRSGARPPAAGDDLQTWALSLPKIDLHRHLEGSWRLTTLVEVARTHGISLPSYDVEALRPYVQMIGDAPDFAGFLDKFRPLRQLYVSHDAIQCVTREAVLDAAADNIRYLELRLNLRTLSRAQGTAFGEVLTWVMEAAAEAQDSSGTRTCLILQIPREEPLEVAEEIVSLAISAFGPLVRGIDLAGNEVDYPPALFRGPFDRARRAGIHTTVHAGEWVGADSVSSAIRDLRPDRIGHGIRALESSEVLHSLTEEGIALEVCPTSNVQTGAVRALDAHPLRELLSQQVRVTLNTDDPSIFDSTLSNETVVSIRSLGITPTQVYRMLRTSVEAAFIPDEERDCLRDRIRSGLASCPGAVTEFDSTTGAS